MARGQDQVDRGETVAYDELGIKNSREEIERRAAEECGKMEEALREIAVIDEPNSAKINWNC
ncbi:MAG: hypothetical protein WBJ70_02165 [Bacilli bacterium]